MPTLNMNGPYDFTIPTIDTQVTRMNAGNYTLGYLNENRAFIPKYVGRADSDLKSRIKQHIGEKYSCFMFSYATSPLAAFNEECRNYHDFEKQLNNVIHPDSPDNITRKCPHCEKYV